MTDFEELDVPKLGTVQEALNSLDFVGAIDGIHFRVKVPKDEVPRTFLGDGLNSVIEAAAAAGDHQIASAESDCINLVWVFADGSVKEAVGVEVGAGGDGGKEGIQVPCVEWITYIRYEVFNMLCPIEAPVAFSSDDFNHHDTEAVHNIAGFHVPVNGSKAGVLVQSNGCLGCDTKPKLIKSVNEPQQGQKLQTRTVSKPIISEDFWTTSTCDMDNSAAQSRGSISSISTSNQALDAHGTGSGNIPSEFISMSFNVSPASMKVSHTNQTANLINDTLEHVTQFSSNNIEA
ncbi:hypothetical protein RJ640_005482 [Escallonia rubra]|uniref:Uncharacterized protein n=1 Tax=Escallonia rubra TaxID=112253 RepID=A0AA88SHP0_9ASTE|nr:hypothetical protein RJ640_005482 [Escallonia rubra]